MYFAISRTIWSLRNEKLKYFFGKITLIHAPPLVTFLRDITQLTNQGGFMGLAILGTFFFSKMLISEAPDGPRGPKIHSRIA